MKYKTKNDMIRGIVIILFSFFLGGVIAGNIDGYLFLIWLFPLLAIMVYFIFILKFRKSIDLDSTDISKKNMAFRWRLVSFVLGFIIIFIGSRILNNKEIFLLIIGLILLIFAINILINLYYKKTGGE